MAPRFPLPAPGLGAASFALVLDDQKEGIHTRGLGVKNNILAKTKEALPAPGHGDRGSTGKGNTNKVFRESSFIQVILMLIKVEPQISRPVSRDGEACITDWVY